LKFYGFDNVSNVQYLINLTNNTHKLGNAGLKGIGR
jgi:hypothetical protein